MARKPVKTEQRTREQLREHYEIEKELATRLRNASRQERRSLYASLYDEMYRRVPLNPRLTQKSSPQETALAVFAQIELIKRFWGNEMTFLEVGAGDCALSFEAARFVKQVYAVDVSSEITKRLTPPSNFRLILSDGSSIPLPANSVHVAYSNQLMEHLHPDDAFEQLKNIYHALMPGGAYICVTPNRLGGPHDISKYFDEVATGFHLKEYTVLELSRLFETVGFSQIRFYMRAKQAYIGLPTFPFSACERLLEKLPYAQRNGMIRMLPCKLLLDIRLVGMK